MMIGAVLGFQYPLHALSGDDLDPIGPFQAPEPMVEIKPDSGPVLVLIEYEIAHEDTLRFLELMRERRRIRLRDWARRWALLRDIERPLVWVESYYSPTWIEYLRHHGRRVRADADNLASLRSLHRGPKDLRRVHRLIDSRIVPTRSDFPPKPEAML